MSNIISNIFGTFCRYVSSFCKDDKIDTNQEIENVDLLSKKTFQNDLNLECKNKLNLDDKKIVVKSEENFIEKETLDEEIISDAELNSLVSDFFYKNSCAAFDISEMKYSQFIRLDRELQIIIAMDSKKEELSTDELSKEPQFLNFQKNIDEEEYLNIKLKNSILLSCVNLEELNEFDFLDKKSSSIFIKRKIEEINKLHSKSEKYKGICENIFKNFHKRVKEAYIRINQDKNNIDFIEKFGIEKNDELVSLSPLGDETHNEGSTPFLCVFKSGKKIIYKPRSLIAEEIISGKTDGIFLNIGLDDMTYAVLNKNKYGYCEFISEDPTKSINKEDAANFMKRMLIMQSLSEMLRIGDLHENNIIIKNKKPFFIDLEVCMVPKIGFGPENTLLMYEYGCNQGLKRIKNYINFDLKNNENGFCQDFINEFEKKETDISFFKKELNNKKITFEKKINKLFNGTHRIVLISTKTLNTILLTKDFELAFGDFLTDLEKGFEKYGLDVNANQNNIKNFKEHFKENFKKDYFNHDIPIFHFCPQTKEVYYHKQSIGIVKD